MPMYVEVCATCGCSEFSHHPKWLACDAECPFDCTGEHWAEDDWECECGSCADFHYLDDPDAVLCTCGCDERDHVAEPDDGPGVDRACEGSDCGCEAFVEAGTAYQVLLDRLEAEPARPPVPPGPEADGTLSVRWIDEPLQVVGALVADRDGQPVRVAGRPGPEDRVFLFFAIAEDGLEVAIGPDELHR